MIERFGYKGKEEEEKIDEERRKEEEKRKRPCQQLTGAYVPERN